MDDVCALRQVVSLWSMRLVVCIAAQLLNSQYNSFFLQVHVLRTKYTVEDKSIVSLHFL
jgi:hypothetical protein